MLLGYGYMRNNLVNLGGYLAHQDVVDMWNLFYFYSVFIFCDALSEISPSEAKWDE